MCLSIWGHPLLRAGASNRLPGESPYSMGAKMVRPNKCAAGGLITRFTSSLKSKNWTVWTLNFSALPTGKIWPSSIIVHPSCAVQGSFRSDYDLSLIGPLREGVCLKPGMYSVQCTISNFIFSSFTRSPIARSSLPICLGLGSYLARPPKKRSRHQSLLSKNSMTQPQIQWNSHLKIAFPLLRWPADSIFYLTLYVFMAIWVSWHRAKAIPLILLWWWIFHRRQGKGSGPEMLGILPETLCSIRVRCMFLWYYPSGTNAGIHKIYTDSVRVQELIWIAIHVVSINP